MPQLASTDQTQPEAASALPSDLTLTPDERAWLEAQIDFALYLLTRPAGTPAWDLLSSRQRGLIRGARQIALASIDSAKLQEGAF